MLSRSFHQRTPSHGLKVTSSHRNQTDQLHQLTPLSKAPLPCSPAKDRSQSPSSHGFVTIQQIAVPELPQSQPAAVPPTPHFNSNGFQNSAQNYFTNNDNGQRLHTSDRFLNMDHGSKLAPSDFSLNLGISQSLRNNPESRGSPYMTPSRNPHLSSFKTISQLNESASNSQDTHRR